MEVITYRQNVTLPKDVSVVKYLLECPVCAEYMTGKVRLCIMGHSICEGCFDSLRIMRKTCPLCRKALSPSGARNFFLESLAAMSKFSCKFADRGCNKEMEGYFYELHLQECCYRDFKCETFGIHQICNKVPLRYKDFIDHLIQDHEVPVVPNGAWVEKRFCADTGRITPSLILVEFDEKIFFSHVLPFPTRFLCLQSLYQHIFMRWIMVADYEDEARHSTMSSSSFSGQKPYNFQLVTKYTGEQTRPASLTSRSCHNIDCQDRVRRNEAYSSKIVEIDSSIREGEVLQLSKFPRNFTTWTKQDENSLFGFSLNDKNYHNEVEICWLEKVLVIKPCAANR